MNSTATNTEKRPTLATLKAFAKRNASNLHLKVSSRFDGMCDGVRSVEDEFSRVDGLDLSKSNTLGIQGVWLVNGSSDSISHFDNGSYQGFRVYNGCGSFTLATPKVADTALVA